MRRLITFDTWADSGQVAERSSELRAISGVRTVEVLEATQGSPRFCLLLETDDAQDAQVGATLESFLGQYAAYVSNVSQRVLRRIG